MSIIYVHTYTLPSYIMPTIRVWNSNFTHFNYMKYYTTLHWALFWKKLITQQVAFFFVCLYAVTSKSSKIASPEQCCQLGIFVARPDHFLDLELATKRATCLWVGCWRWHQYAVRMKFFFTDISSLLDVVLSPSYNVHYIQIAKYAK